jgi:hypothetical protein
MLLDNTDWEVRNRKDPLQENQFARFAILAKGDKEEKRDKNSMKRLTNEPP